jgi:hypothetical protein
MREVYKINLTKTENNSFMVDLALFRCNLDNIRKKYCKMKVLKNCSECHSSLAFERRW